MSPMGNRRRPGQEPPSATPVIQHTPGLAEETLRELAPLLAEEGIDVDNIDADPATLQAALDRAVERLNMARFTPVGAARDHAITTLRLVVEAIADDDPELADAILESVPPEAPDGKSATVAGCIGVALGVLDEWLGGHDSSAPSGLAQEIRLSAGDRIGERAARDIIALACKRRAFRSLGALITRQGGRNVLYGSALALSATVGAWSERTGTPVIQLAGAQIR